MSQIETIVAAHPHAVRIAVLEEKIAGLREQQKAHHETSQKRLDAIDGKLDTLTALTHRGRGAYAVSVVVASALGALLLELVGMIPAFFHLQ